MREKLKAEIFFTMVELLVVISIICLLMCLLLPALSKAKEKARDIQCRGQIRSLAQASHMYANDNNDYMPTRHEASSGGFDWSLDRGDYMKVKTGTFTCPMKRGDEASYGYSQRVLPNGSTAVVNLGISMCWGYYVPVNPVRSKKIGSMTLPGKTYLIGDARATSSNAYVYYYGIAYIDGEGITTRHNGKYNFMMLSGDIQQRNDIIY